MDPKKYKQFHEAHMSHNTGTSIEECVLLLSALPFSVFISLWLSSFTPKSFHLVSEFIVLLLPIILSCTILSNVNSIFFYNCLIMSLTIILRNINLHTVNKQLNSIVLQGKKSYITNYRACTIFISSLCILAVDFNIFPKRLAKTETFGFGFMDLGVGFFVCSNGLVEKNIPSSNLFLKVMKSILIFFILGAVRLLSVKSLDYHEHVSEYGVHWNFFFTLGMCRLISYLINVLTNYANPLWLSLGVGVTHQSFLWLGLQDWVLSNQPRNSIFSANKEGLASCLGYICLYFASSSLGKFIKHSSNLTYKQFIYYLILVCLLNWMGTFIFLSSDKVSRRLINLGYIFWILALSSTELTLFVILEICLLGIQKVKIKEIQTVPQLYDSINSNGLFFFLLSNLLTGLVNILFQTLLLGQVISLAIIISYVVILCTITYFLYMKKIFLKLK